MVDNALLIGGSGFIGTAVAENLARRNIKFTVLSRSKVCPPRLAQMLKQSEDLGVYAHGDCRDKRLIDELIARHSHIVHMAYTNMKGVSCADPSTELMDNLSCATKVFDSTARHGKKWFSFRRVVRFTDQRAQSRSARSIRWRPSPPTD
jgi:nucleoside-diphosphate-sugar epimerase